MRVEGLREEFQGSSTRFRCGLDCLGLDYRLAQLTSFSGLDLYRTNELWDGVAGSIGSIAGRPNAVHVLFGAGCFELKPPESLSFGVCP